MHLIFDAVQYSFVTETLILSWVKKDLMHACVQAVGEVWRDLWPYAVVYKKRSRKAGES